jgi:hypothetical protein
MTEIADYTNQYDIRVGMYGFDTIIYKVPEDMALEPIVEDRRFGGKRQMTLDQNTSISGVAVLIKDEQGIPHIDIYHNIFATIPLDIELLREHGTRQFRLQGYEQGKHQEWIEI